MASILDFLSDGLPLAFLIGFGSGFGLGALCLSVRAVVKLFVRTVKS